jgi:hypothetical protein
MSYDNGYVEEHVFNDTTFGATSVTHQIIGPKGKVGFVRDIMVDIATSLVGTTTVPEIDLGISSGDSTFGRYRLGQTAILGYTTGQHRASTEAITGNPPRALADFTGHVILDGGPLDANFRVQTGRIPASGLPVSNVISGTSSVARVFLNVPALDVNLKVGQLVQTRGIAGATASGMTVGTLLDGYAPISAISAVGVSPWIELSGTTFGGTYTAGGIVNPITLLTNAAGTGGSPAGGGIVRVVIEWIGTNLPQ